MYDKIHKKKLRISIKKFKFEIKILFINILIGSNLSRIIIFNNQYHKKNIKFLLLKSCRGNLYSEK